MKGILRARAEQDNTRLSHLATNYTLLLIY